VLAQSGLSDSGIPGGLALPTWTQARSELALLHRNHPHDEEAIAAARQRYRVARTEAYIRRLVDEAPPLTREQLDQLAALLRPGRAA
jgi:hypothetical protein